MDWNCLLFGFGFESIGQLWRVNWLYAGFGGVARLNEYLLGVLAFLLFSFGSTHRMYYLSYIYNSLLELNSSLLSIFLKDQHLR